MVEKDIPLYGELNQIQKKDTKNHLDISKRGGVSVSVLKETIVSTNTANDYNKGPYFGFVIRVYAEAENTDGIWTKMRAHFANVSWTAKVRIPELHAHIPLPRDFIGDTDLIEAHTTFAPINPELKKPEPGDYVRVDYRDGEGFIIETIKDDQGKNKKVYLPMNPVGAKGTFKTGP